MFVFRRYRSISEVHVLDGFEIIDVGKLFLKRSPCGEDLQQRWPRHGLDDQPIPFFVEHGLGAGELEVPRDTDCLVAPVPKQAHDSLSVHGILPAVDTAYAKAYASTN
jgi:hypothetical protein